MTNNPPSFPKRVTSLITQHPWLSLIAGLLCMVGVCFGLPRMQANFTHTAFFKAGDAELERFNEFERRFGNDDAVIVVVHSPSGVFDVETATLLRELTNRMWKVSEVVRVDSLANFRWVHAQGDEIEVEALFPEEGTLTPELLLERKKVALSHELLPGYLVSKDGTSALIYARIKPGLDAPPNSQKIVADAHRVVDAMRRGDHEFHLLGGPVINDAFRESSERDMSTLLPVLLGMLVLLLVATFRRVAGVVLPFVVIIFTIVATLALSGWLGVEMSSVTMAVPNVLIAVCVADIVHLLSTFYQARKRGLTRREAADFSLHKNFVPTILTSVTTVVGFFSFATAKLPPVAGFGILAGLGTAVAWFVTYSIIGGMMVLWPGKDGDAQAERSPEAHLEATPRAKAFVAFVDRYRVTIVGSFVLLSAVSVAIGTRNVINTNPYEYFARGVAVREAQDFVLSNVSGIATFELVVDSGREDGVRDPKFMNTVATFEEKALELPGITRAVSLVDILRQMNRALNGGDDREYKLPQTAQGIAQELLLYTMGLPQGMDVNDRVTVKNDALRITLVSTIRESSMAVQTAHQLEQMGAEQGLKIRATGKTLLYHGMEGRVVGSFLSSLLLAIVFIGAIVFVAFRSPKLCLISAVPNLVPLAAGAAVLYFLSGTLDIGTVMVASACLGIAVDNTIHLLTGYVRHRSTGSTSREALEQVLTHTGPAMIWTTVILIVGFGTLAFGVFMPNVYFGLLCAIILTIALVADIVLLPALLLLTDSRAKATVSATIAQRSGDLGAKMGGGV